MKKAMLWFEPATVGVLRILGALVFLAAVQLWYRETWPIARKDMKALLFVGLLGYALPRIDASRSIGY